MRTPLSRRTFLRGAGALVALPLLDAMLPGKAAHAAGFVPRRFVAYFVPCGIHMADYTPQRLGRDFDLTPILSPLERLRSDLVVVSGLDNISARPDGAGDHAAGTGSFLTARHVRKTEGENISNGISVDQQIALAVGMNTRLPSLVLGAEGGGSIGGCDSGYSCAYSRNISWAGERTPIGKEVDPRSVFDRMFAGQDSTLTELQIKKRHVYRKSILDFVRADATALHSKLGATDRQKVDEYLTGVRELERQLDQSATAPVCQVPGAPGEPPDLPALMRSMTDLMVLAMQCDQTRVVSFMLGNGGSNRAYPFLDVAEGHHELSHHQNKEENFRKLAVIDTWEVSQLAYLLERMKSIQEGEGTLLSNSLVFWSSEIEDGNAHRHTNLPVLLAGQAGGRLATGRHVKVEGGTPIANLYVSLLNLMGVEASTFGADATGPLGELA